MSASTRTRTAVASSSPTVTPYLTVEPAEQVIAFIKDVFGAHEQGRGIGSQGGLHCGLTIGDSQIMVGGGGHYQGPYFPTSLHIYVRDCDSTYGRALKAGATSLRAPQDQFYGDREAAVQDVGGTEWYIATHLGSNYRPQGVPDLMLYLHPTGAERLVDFMKRAFGATEVAVDRVDEATLREMKSMDRSMLGTIVHAKLRVGNSIVEMGEAHGQWQNRPTTIFLLVDDCDNTYARAIAAGGVSLEKPKDMPFGHRVGTVQDEFGNRWYVSAPI